MQVIKAWHNVSSAFTDGASYDIYLFENHYLTHYPAVDLCVFNRRLTLLRAQAEGGFLPASLAPLDEIADTFIGNLTNTPTWELTP